MVGNNVILVEYGDFGQFSSNKHSIYFKLVFYFFLALLLRHVPYYRNSLFSIGKGLRSSSSRNCDEDRPRHFYLPSNLTSQTAPGRAGVRASLIELGFKAAPGCLVARKWNGKMRSRKSETDVPTSLRRPVSTSTPAVVFWANTTRDYSGIRTGVLTSLMLGAPGRRTKRVGLRAKLTQLGLKADPG